MRTGSEALIARAAFSGLSSAAIGLDADRNSPVSV